VSPVGASIPSQARARMACFDSSSSFTRLFGQPFGLTPNHESLIPKTMEKNKWFSRLDG